MSSTEIYFRYSPIYDRTIASLSDQVIDDRQIHEGYLFVERYAKYWRTKSRSIFGFYEKIGLSLPSFWLAYPVHYQVRLLPFSDPLTFFINDNYDSTAATLVHEICHVFFGYRANAAVSKRLWNPIAERFADQSVEVQEHILVVMLACGAYFRIFDANTVASLVERECGFPSLARTWNLVMEVVGNDIEKLREPLNVICSQRKGYK